MSSFFARLRAGVFHHDAPDLQHVAELGHLERHVRVLLHQQDGDAALAVDAHDDAEDLLRQQGRQAQARLVEQHHLRAATAAPARSPASAAARPESCPASCLARAREDREVAEHGLQVAAPRRRGRGACRRPCCRLSSTESSGNTSRPSGTCTTPRAHDAVGRPALDLLRRAASPGPWRGSMMPEMVFRIVVLPAPLAPSTVTILPFGHRRGSRRAAPAPGRSSTPRSAARGSVALHARPISSRAQVGLDHRRMRLHLAPACLRRSRAPR